MVEDAAAHRRLEQTLDSAGYQVFSAALAEGVELLRSGGAELLLIEEKLRGPRLVRGGQDVLAAVAELKGSVATAGVRVVLLSDGDAADRARALDVGADDVLPTSCDLAELLARVRAQFRVRQELEALREKMRIAEEGQKIAHTAFEALAVTEKMTRDAFSLDRRLKIGLSVLFAAATVIVAVFFLYRSRAEKETRRAYAVIAQLERRFSGQEDLLAETRRMRQVMQQTTGEKQQLEQRSSDLRARIASGAADDVAALRQQLAETSSRLRRIESEGQIAQNIIRSYAPSICLLHVVVAFRDIASEKRIRYAGINPQGEPLQDSEGNPIFTLDGRGPEVRADFFGTGFLAAANGRILTNRHVVEPWWRNDELTAVTQQGMEPVIAEISAYFPDSPRAYRVEIQKVSPDTDLAAVQGDLGDLKRAPLALDVRSQAAVSGQPLVSVGYATGIAAILARAGEDSVRDIVSAAGGNARLVMAELARRNLIRPLTTQGHIGDVLPDKIVFDAQTTSGGSGGPLFNREGKVIGVTFAVVRGFGGSNFGIPIRFAQPLLSP